MFNTQEERDNYAKARELKNIVDNWVSREFNFIDLEVYEKCNECLYESIVQPPLSEHLSDFIYNLSPEEKAELMEEAKEDLGHEEVSEEDFKSFLVDSREDEIREWAEDNCSIENYPRWSTLFEFRSEPPEEWVKVAQEVGLGVIEPQEAFNTTLFMTSGGHSFYSSYWIPLYLKLFKSEAEKYAGVNFDSV